MRRLVSTDPRVLVVDSEGRLALPKATREHLGLSDGGGVFHITIDHTRRVLAFQTMESLDRFARFQARSIGAIEADILDSLHDSHLLAPVDKRGRFVVPEDLRKRAGIRERARISNYRQYISITEPGLADRLEVERSERIQKAMERTYGTTSD